MNPTTLIMKLKYLTGKKEKKTIYKKSKTEVKNIQLTDWVLTFLTVEFQPRKKISYLHMILLYSSLALIEWGELQWELYSIHFWSVFMPWNWHIFSSLKYAPDFLWAFRHFLTCHNSRNTLEIVVGLCSLLQKITGCGLFSSSLNRAVYFVWLC